jgi:hypothetical protein
MVVPVYRPFERFIFDDQTCFLSGKKNPIPENLTVFPEWLMQNYKLADKPFKLLDESIITYKEIKVTCSSDILPEIHALENVISAAFTSGYKYVEQLNQVQLFQWIAKLVYGIIYHEIKTGLHNKDVGAPEFDLSQALIHKFSNLHLMLQSIIRPVVFEGVVPWTILIFPVNNPPETFIYRDEINTLTFSLRMQDFGIIACLQDNNANYVYHKEILDTIAGKTLHPIQFEELCAKFFYSAYLFNRLPQYTVLPTEDAIYIEAMPLSGTSNKPVFDVWQNKIYGQVLENFWKAWGFTRLEITKDQERPMSFLLDDNDEFIPGETIGVPVISKQ